MASIDSILQDISSGVQQGTKSVVRTARKELESIVNPNAETYSSSRNYSEQPIEEGDAEVSMRERAMETATRLNRARRNAQRAVAVGRAAYATGSLAVSGTSAAVGGIASFFGFTAGALSAGSVALIVGAVLVIFIVFSLLSSIAQDVSNPLNAGRYIAECKIEGREDIAGCVGEKSAQKAAVGALERQGNFRN